MRHIIIVLCIITATIAWSSHKTWKYRVFRKEAEKVKGYCTAKKWILGSDAGFIVTVRMRHLINCIKHLTELV